MSDQCRYCTLLGDIDKCMSVYCLYHKSWYVSAVLDKQVEACVTALQSMEFPEARKQVEQIKAIRAARIKA